MSHFEKRVQLNKIIESQLPEFLVADFPKAVEFFKQYYISQESQGGNIDLIDNLDRYIKLDNLIPEVVVGKTTLLQILMLVYYNYSINKRISRRLWSLKD